MEVLFWVLTAGLVFAVAAVLVGREAFRLGHQPPAAIFDLDEAVKLVGDGLGEDAQSRLSYRDVREVVLATLGYLESKGLSAMPGQEPRLTGEGPPVVVAENEALAVALGRLDELGAQAEDADVLEVIDGLLGYLRDIGALGPPVEPPADPSAD